MLQPIEMATFQVEHPVRTFFSEVVNSMKWEKVIDGNIPKDAIGSFTPKIYFCQVYDEASVSALYVLDSTK